MRVSDRALFQAVQAGVERAQSRLLDAQQKIASGLRAPRPKDDPALHDEVARLDGEREGLAGMASAAERAASDLEMAEGALGEAQSLVVRARELAVRMASVATAADRAAARVEVDALRAEMIALGNTDAGGRYLFAGLADGAPAFDAAGAFQGSATTREVEAAPGLLSGAQVRGDTAFDAALQALQDLSVALGANDGAATRASLAGLDAGLEALSAARASAGLGANALRSASAWVQLRSDALAARRGRLADADFARAVSDLKTAERALEAASAAGGRALPLMLLQVLR